MPHSSAAPTGEALAIAALLEYLGDKHVTAEQINYAAHHITDAQLRVGYEALIGAYINSASDPGQQLDIGFAPYLILGQIPDTNASAPIPTFSQDAHAAQLIGQIEPIGNWFMGNPFAPPLGIIPGGVPDPVLPTWWFT